MDLNRLIANAEIAYQRCESTNSEWGMLYWSNVLSSLLRRARRMN